MRLLGWMLPGAKETALPPPTNADYRVLFIRYERIGDMIMATSLIRNIAMALPAGKVDVIATPTTASVLEGNPYVGRVLLLERNSFRSYSDLMKKLRRERARGLQRRDEFAVRPTSLGLRRREVDEQ